MCSFQLEACRAVISRRETLGQYHTIMAAQVLREVDHIVELYCGVSWIMNAELGL